MNHQRQDIIAGAEGFKVILKIIRIVEQGDTASLEGKRIGVNKNSYQEMLFLDWAKERGLEVEIVELMTSQEESINMLKNGEIDAFLTIDVYIENQHYYPVAKIGKSEFFFAISNKRPELLRELDLGMSKIQDENRSYNQQLYDRYVRSQGLNAYLSSEELEWLADQGTIRVGYLEDYLPFCSVDSKTGRSIVCFRLI